MRAPGAVQLAALIAALALPAGAEDAAPSSVPPSLEPRNAVSLELPGVLGLAVVLDGERYVEGFRWSVLVAVGARWAAQADYRSWTLGLGGGARFWINWLRLPLESTLGGLFIGVRLDGAWAHVQPRSGGGELTSGAVSLGLRLGYRVVFWRHLELTLEAGPALSMSLDAVPSLVAVPRLSGAAGLTVGYLF